MIFITALDVVEETYFLWYFDTCVMTLRDNGAGYRIEAGHIG